MFLGSEANLAVSHHLLETRVSYLPASFPDSQNGAQAVHRVSSGFLSFHKQAARMMWVPGGMQ